MATKPDAARGKTTRKGRIKKIFNRLKEEQKGNKPLGMSPGALGGRTERQVPPPIPRENRRPLIRKEFGDDLQNIRDRADKIAETIIGTFPMVGSKTMRRAFNKKNTEETMADGGEVMDLTTEIDVE